MGAWSAVGGSMVGGFNKTQNKDRKEQRGETSFSESVRAKLFCCAFKLGFLQFSL